MTPQQRIQRAHVQLMRSKEFCGLSGILMCGEVKIDKAIPTACTDGFNVMYGEAFLDTIDERTLNWVVLHENFHKLLKQLTVWKALFEQDAKLANIASDYVVNLMIHDMDPSGRLTSRWPHALFNEQYRGMDTKRVFELLKQNPPPAQQEQGKKGQQVGDKPFDSHQWEEAQNVSDKEQATRGVMIDQAARQGAEIARKRGGTGAWVLDKLLEPTVDWRAVLADFINSAASGKDISTWRKPNRRWLGQGMYMPSAYSETMGPIVVALDASGSVSQADLAVFASELAGICSSVMPERVHVVWWHHNVANTQVFDRDSYETMANQLKPAGSGGTVPQCVIDWTKDEGVEPECVIFLTDGYVSEWPTALAVPTLWAITTDVVAPTGQTVKVKI